MGQLEYIASVVRFRCVAVPFGRPKSKGRILARLASATLGNFGDCEPVGEGVSEMRIHVGAGYRVYYTRTGSTVYVLLAGGVKASQTKDIAKAKKMARELKRAKQ
jgi:putative addiction module killer protein